MPLSNDIVLRPRFKIEVPRYNEAVLSDFQNAKATQSEFVVIRVEEHVFIRLPKDKQKFWSPQLHLEINAVDENSCVVRGLFGPKPTVWTLFMFLHFLVAGLFIAFGIWTYSNWTLEQNFTIQASVTILMVLLWVTLYFVGSFGKASSINEMRALNNFMYEVLNLKTS
ncbi:GTP-binding protein [Sabulilitoribacter multivorans]|uniref:GTP-binding protein n=1 Tax=Flaviramulus multivorans TaxID=1304750 RepID=A0ABS9IIR9_9FLAO|nr:GTP-binding protein [Flaviramulus multivorans]MCF7560609.1 GTP-binding protein [Flaviramulus multivorans]